MKHHFTGPFLDYGDDLNLYVPEEKGKHDGGFSKTLFVDDTIKSVDIALAESRKKMAPYWLNSDPVLAGYVDEVGEAFLIFMDEEFKSRVLMFEFMDFYAPHTLRGLPYTKEWLKRYEGAGLSVVGIFNSPYGFEKDLEHVAQEAHRLGIHFPILIDHDFALWRALENRYQPRRILFDHEQKVIADFVGAGGYREMEQLIQESLRKISPGLACPRLMPLVTPRDENKDVGQLTPSQFFGFRRGVIANEEELSTVGNDVIFTPPAKLEPHSVYLKGPWMGTNNSIYPAAAPYEKNQYSEDSVISLTFQAANVYILCGSRKYQHSETSATIRAGFLMDGKPIRDTVRGADLKNEGKKQFINVGAPKLHEVVKEASPDTVHRLDIVLGKETADIFEIYAVYFTN